MAAVDKEDVLEEGLPFGAGVENGETLGLLHPLVRRDQTTIDALPNVIPDF